MKIAELKSGSRAEIPHLFDVDIFEVVYPLNELTGRALYKVRDRRTQLFYALKTFALDLNNQGEIQKEILSLNGFDLGNIAPKCRSFSISGNEGLLLMDWFEGKTLAQKYPSAPEDIYDLRDRVAQLQGLCWAVDKIHSKKIFHRDLKPENIIISSERGPGAKIKLIDFGMSNVRRGENRREGSSFRAPEQDGRRDFNLKAQVDIFAIGKIGWWLLTGNNPQFFEDEDTFADWENLDSMNLQEECPLATKSLDSALKGALAYKPEKRYRNARQFEIALKNCKLKEG